MEKITEMKPDEAYNDEIALLRSEVRNFGGDGMTRDIDVKFGELYSNYLPEVYMSPNTSLPDRAYKYKFDG